MKFEQVNLDEENLYVEEIESDPDTNDKIYPLIVRIVREAKPGKHAVRPRLCSDSVHLLLLRLQSRRRKD